MKQRKIILTAFLSVLLILGLYGAEVLAEEETIETVDDVKYTRYVDGKEYEKVWNEEFEFYEDKEYETEVGSSHKLRVEVAVPDGYSVSYNWKQIDAIYTIETVQLGYDKEQVVTVPEGTYFYECILTIDNGEGNPVKVYCHFDFCAGDPNFSARPTAFINGEKTDNLQCSVGEKVTLYVRNRASASFPVTYTWGVNRKDIEGTGKTLVITKGTGSETYYCKVKYEGSEEQIVYFYLTEKPCSHVYTNKVVKATTVKNGNITKYCTKCGNQQSITTIPAAKSVSLSATTYTYDGKMKKPTVTVKGSDGKALSTSNYSVSYSSGRKNVGKYTVKVTFKGNYTGTVSKTFKINPKKTSVSKIKAGKKKMTVKWKKQSKQVTGYQIQYSTDKKFKKSVKTSTVTKYKTSSKTIKKLKAKKKYYVRIRTYKKVGSTKYYSGWSSVKSIKVK